MQKDVDSLMKQNGNLARPIIVKEKLSIPFQILFQKPQLCGNSLILQKTKESTKLLKIRILLHLISSIKIVLQVGINLDLQQETGSNQLKSALTSQKSTRIERRVFQVLVIIKKISRYLIS